MQLSFFRRFRWLLLVALCVMSGTLHAEPLLKEGDRLVFLGDETAEFRTYPRYVADFITLRYPGMKVSFLNLGQGWGTAPQGADQLQNNLQTYKPTIVTICYGMNDGHKGNNLPPTKEFDRKRYDAYMAGMTRLVKGLKDAGVRVVVLTPGCVDPDRDQSLRAYDAVMARYADGLVEFAHRENVPVFDLYRLTKNVLVRGKADDKNFSLMNEGLIPNNAGFAIMAYGLLCTLQCMQTPASIEINAAQSVSSPVRCKISALAVQPDFVTFTCTVDALPTFFDGEVQTIEKYLPIQKELNTFPLKVLGLKAGQWKLNVQNQELGTFTSEQLAVGVNLTPLPGPWKQLAAEANRSVDERENYFNAYTHFIRGRSFPKEAEAERQAFVNKIVPSIQHCEEAQIKKLGDPANRTWNWVLTLAK